MRYHKVPHATDAGLGGRARIGLLVLKTDQTIEHEAREMLAGIDGVALHHARLYNDAIISRDTLLAMKPLIPGAAALLPAEWGFTAIAYACTSGAMVIGEAEVERLVRSEHPRSAVTNPVTACLAAFRALAARRIAVVTPYARAVNDTIAAGLSARGLEVAAFASFEEPDDAIVGRITPAAVLAAARAAISGVAVDAVFVSCTSLRLAAAIDGMEAALGVPVTSSNHATIWHLLRLAGIADRIDGFGRLLRLGLAAAPAAAAE